jgi:hypothetical protein
MKRNSGPVLGSDLRHLHAHWAYAGLYLTLRLIPIANNGCPTITQNTTLKLLHKVQKLSLNCSLNQLPSSCPDKFRQRITVNTSTR